MEPATFPGVNVVFGKGQEEYRELPALRTPDGTVITFWKFTPEEKERLRDLDGVYIQQLTFNNALQPILPMLELSDGIALLPDSDQ
jgi:hypothetical protein